MKAKSILVLMTLSLLLLGVQSSCEEGCLSCELDSTGNPLCKVCDLHNFYRLSNSGRCFKRAVENCEVPSSDHSVRVCNLCKPGFFLDNRGNRCSPVPEKFLTPDCKRYRWEYSCTQCNEGFYLMKNRCQPVATVIENCSVYVDAKTCSECKEGFFYHLGTKKCETLTKRSQCLVYSSVQCTKCTAGHFQIDNVASGVSLSADFVQSLATYSINETSSSAFYETKPVNQCVLGTLENCKTHATFNQCSECQPGFFLSPSKNCQSDPIRTVAHCLAYGAANTCTRCSSAYYLLNNICRELSEISGCLEFDPMTKHCLKCDSENFYMDAGFCGARNKSVNISFCQDKNPNMDECQTCIPSFQLTDDHLKCLPHIPHCQTYVTNTSVIHQDYTNVSTVALRCSLCDEHFYLSLNIMACIPQDSVGCVTFTPNTNICIACASGFFLTSDACSPYTVSFCKTYNTTMDECTACFDGYFLLGTVCTKYTARNCLTFEASTNNCATCLNQYFLLTSGLPAQTNCEPLTATNCKTFTNTGSSATADSCATCYQGYVKEGINCVPISLLNCAVPTVGANTCATCKMGYYKNVNNICKAYTAKNCDVYTADKDECTSCLHFVSSGSPLNVYYKTTEKKCLPYTVHNCLTKTDTENKCATCADSVNWYISSQGECIPSHLNHCISLVTSTPNDQCQTCAHGYKLSAGQCHRLNTAGCKTYSAENCETCSDGFYFDTTVCKPYTVSNCATYVDTSDACASCIDGFNLASGKCEPILINFCSKYDTTANRACTECQTGYYKNNLVCLPQNISGCLKYVLNKNECAECRVGFTWVDVSTCTAKTYVEGCMRLKPTDLNKCAICHQGYIQNPSTLICTLAPVIPGCIQYQENTGKCEVCSLGKAPNTAGAVCEAITYTSVPNCVDYDPSTGKCQACEYMFYLNATKTCSSQNVSQCKTHTPNKNECLQCKNGYHLYEGSCKAYPILANCVHYSADRLSCQICANNYYPEHGVCKKSLLAKCTMKIPNENKCYSCLPNYFLGGEKDCEGSYKSPTDVNCFQYSKELLKCEFCNVGYFLNSDFVCEAFTIGASDFKTDPTCLAQSTQDGVCKFCPQANVSVPLNIVRQDKANYTGCAKISTSTGNCTQCLPDYESPDSATKVCTAWISGPKICKQLKENAANGTSLNTGTDCFECSDKQKYYNNSGTCTKIDKVNVLELNQANGTILYCENGTIYKAFSSSIQECGTVNNKTAAQVNTIVNCDVFNYDDQTCTTCAYGYENNSTTCDDSAKVPAIGLYIKLNTDSQYEIDSWFSTAAHTTAQFVVQYGTGNTGTVPTACVDGKVRTITVANKDGINYKPNAGLITNLDNYRTNNVEFARSYPIHTCEDIGTKFASITTSNPPIVADKDSCSYWLLATEGAMVCKGCLGAKFPVYEATNEIIESSSGSEVATASALADNYVSNSVTECLTLAAATTKFGAQYNLGDLRKQYQGLNYHSAGSFIPYSHFLNFDSCNSAANILIVFARYSSPDFIPQTHNYNIGSVSTSSHPMMTCRAFSDIGADSIFDSTADNSNKYNLQGGVPNCEINYWNAQSNDTDAGGSITNQITSGDSAAGSRLSCMACRPGYSGITNTVGGSVIHITSGENSKLLLPSCTIITNCNQGGTNTWLNACETCDANYSWLVSNTFVVLFNECHTLATADPNCLMVQEVSGTTTADLKCLICKTGYLLNTSGVCVNTLANCTTIGHPMFKLEANTGDSKVNYMVFNFLVQKLFAGPKPIYCETCAGQAVNMVRATGTNCSHDFAESLDSTVTAATNCDYFGPTMDKCLLCIDDNTSNKFSLKTTDKTCTAKSGSTASDRYGCLKNDGAGLCTECRPGYVSYDDTGSMFCYLASEIETEFNCVDFDNSTKVCNVCKKGFVIDSNDPIICKVWTNEDCNQETTLGMCMECKVANHFPIHYKINGAANNPLYTFNCVDQSTADFADLVATQVYYDFNDNTVYTKTDKLLDNEFYIIYTDMTSYNTALSKNYRDRCLKVISAPFENCLEASLNGMKCNKCKPGYQLIVNATDHNECVEKFSSCLELYPGTDNCRICKPEFKKDGASGLCVVRSLTNAEFINDDVCVGNASTDLGCDMCQDGNNAIDLKYFHNTGTYTGCLQTDPDTGFCTFCDQSHNFDANSLTCTNVTTPSDCKFLKPGLTVTTGLGGSTDCMECIDRFHLDTGTSTCYDASSIYNAHTISGTSSLLPTKCAPGKFLQTTSSTKKHYECAIFNTDMTSPTASCLAFSPDGTCTLCPTGQVYTSSCGAIANYISTFPTFTTDFNLANLDPGLDATVELGQQINNTTFSAVQCTLANRIATVGFTYGTSSTFKDRISYAPGLPGQASSDLEIFPSYPIISCVAHSATLKYLTNATNDHHVVEVIRNGTAAALTDCALWIMITDVYKCIRCYDGHIPVIKTVTQENIDASSSAYTTTGLVDKAYIHQCVIPAGTQVNLVRSYQGLGYHNIKSFPAGAFISVDNCTDTNKALVVFMTKDSLHQYNLTNSTNSFANAGSHNTNQYCIDLSTDFWAAGAPADKWSLTIANCQINYYSTTNDTTIAKFASSSETFGCFACRPGYHPFSAVTDNQVTTASLEGRIATCTIIPSCNQAVGTNKWMNACQTCDANKVWHYDNTNKFIQYHNCFSFLDSLNCKIGYLGNCVMCKAGYNLLSDGTCINRDKVVKKQCTDTIASTKAYTENNISFIPSTDLTLVTFFFMQYLFQEMNFAFIPECAVCATGHHLMEVPVTSDTYCTNNIYFTTWTAGATYASNCLYWDPTDPTKCSQCIADHIVVANDYTSMSSATCFDITTRKSTDIFVDNCLVVQDSTDFKCIRCKKGFQEKTMGSGGTQYKICYTYLNAAHNCAKFDFTNEKCIVCKNNFVLDSTNSIWCKPPSPALTDSDCSQPADGGRCLKCHGATYYPFHWKPKLANTDYTYACIDQGRVLDDTFFHIIRGFDFNTNHQLLETEYIPFEEHYKNATTFAEYDALNTTGISTPFQKITQLCVKIIESTNSANCTEANNNGFKCSKCSNGKAVYNKIHDFNQCMSGCAVVDPGTQECVLCTDPTKHLSPDRGDCNSSYGAGTANCSYKSPFADTCIYCNTGFYLKTDQTCEPYSIMKNCARRDIHTDKCALCNDGYYLLSNGQCVQSTMNNCRFASASTWGVCLACEAGYELIQGRCVFVSPESRVCKTRNSDGDCASCFDGYTLVNGSCDVTYALSEIEGCINYDQHDNLCVECDENLWLSNGHCGSQEIKHCKVLSEDEDHCVVCESQYYLNGIMCVPRRRFNCLIFAQDKDQCLSCPDHSYLSKGNCVGYTAQNCHTFNKTKDLCVTCSENFYFDQHSRQCLKSGVFNCQVRNHVTDACFSCLPEYYLSNTGICIARTITNCGKFEPFADSCIDCTASHYLVEDTGVFNSDTTTVFNTCKPYTISNCKSFHPRMDKCLVCDQGLYMSSNRGCLARSAFNCASWNDKQSECKTCPTGTYLELGICNPYSVSNCAAYHETSNACLACSKGFFLQQSNCVSYSISDCENFATDKNRCVKCKLGFFLRNGLCEFVSQNNCATHADSKNECSSCETGYYLQNGKCLTYTISCLDYSATSNACLGCPSGQYLELKNNTCIGYTVNNCESYNFSDNKCETCVPNHYFYNGLCLPYTVTNCGVFHSLFDECVTCKSGYYHLKKMCLPYNVANCSQFSPVSDVCISCRNDHYNLNGNCLPYTAEHCENFQDNRNFCKDCATNFYKLNIKEDLYKCVAVSAVSNCEKYAEFTDKCEECSKGFYLAEMTNTCHLVPSTVSNCQEFIDATNCKNCVAPYYLQNNECVKSAHLISKCVKYESNTKCAECDGSNMLSPDATLCLKITEPSCSTYVDPANCKTCAGELVINYIDDSTGDIISGLNGEDLSTRRAICNISGINNCTLARRSFPMNTCLQCASGFFLASSSSCQAVTQQIPNCDTYYANGVCAQCADNHVLSADKSACNYDLSFLGKNCQSGKFFSEPKCFFCRTGFYFNSDGDCLACSMEGCAVCTADASASCRLCKAGFYMNGQMQCVTNGTVASARLEKEVADNGLLTSEFDNETSSALVKRILIPAVLLLSLARLF